MTIIKNVCIARLESDGTRWRTGGEVKGKDANGVGSQQPSTVSEHGLYNCCPLIRTPRLPAVDWTDTPADLNGLVRFAERPNLVSARVPSSFERAHVHWRIYTLLTLHLVIVHKTSDRRQLNILRPSVLLLRLKSMSALVCSGGQQCDVPSNEIVWRKVFACIDCLLTEEFVQLSLQLFCVGKKRVKMQKFSFFIFPWGNKFCVNVTAFSI